MLLLVLFFFSFIITVCWDSCLLLLLRPWLPLFPLRKLLSFSFTGTSGYIFNWNTFCSERYDRSLTMLIQGILTRKEIVLTFRDVCSSVDCGENVAATVISEFFRLGRLNCFSDLKQWSEYSQILVLLMSNLSDKMANVLRMCAARLVLASVLTHKVCESQAVAETLRAEFNLK